MVASAPRSEPPDAKHHDELNIELLNIKIQAPRHGTPNQGVKEMVDTRPVFLLGMDAPLSSLLQEVAWRP